MKVVIGIVAFFAFCFTSYYVVERSEMPELQKQVDDYKKELSDLSLQYEKQELATHEHYDAKLKQLNALVEKDSALAVPLGPIIVGFHSVPDVDETESTEGIPAEIPLVSEEKPTVEVVKK